MLGIPNTAFAVPGGGGNPFSSAKCKKKKGKKGQKSKQKDGGAESGEKSNAAGPTLQRSNRMEFDGRLVKGERASGAVYLFSKARRPLPPLLKVERDRLEDIVWPVLRRPADEPSGAVGDAGEAAPKKVAPEAKPAKADKRKSKKLRKKRRKKKARKGSKR